MYENTSIAFYSRMLQVQMVDLAKLQGVHPAPHLALIRSLWKNWEACKEKEKKEF